MLVNAFCFLFLSLKITRKLVIRMRLYLLANFSFFKIPILLNQCIFHWSLQLYFLVHLFWHFCYSHFIITLILLNLFYHFFGWYLVINIFFASPWYLSLLPPRPLSLWCMFRSVWIYVLWSTDTLIFTILCIKILEYFVNTCYYFVKFINIIDYISYLHTPQQKFSLPCLFRFYFYLNLSPH